ncbi:MAG TPA: hypothetical protein VFC78_14070 [Tepidisphaeraceae bacterium]|nr:hypothetical protein [Tepidisphaeraceae bacterium]
MAVALGLVVGAIGVVLHIRGAHRAETGFSASSSSSTTFACPIPGKFKPVEINVALLCDYYEHGVEHAPPRDPSGVMQRRELHYRAPGDPFDFVKSAASANASDGLLNKEIFEWRQRWASGRSTPLPASIEGMAVASSIGAESLLEMGNAFAFLEDDSAADVWYRAALDKAAKTYRTTSPGDPIALPLLRRLDQTKALWRLRDYPALETRFSLASRLSPSLSPESRRAGYLHAEMLFYQNRFDEAADCILQVQDQHDRAGDLGRLEKSDAYEMTYMLGLFLFKAARLTQAMPELTAIADAPDEGHRENIMRCRIVTLASLGRPDEARGEFARWRALNPEASSNAAVAGELMRAINASKWKNASIDPTPVSGG